MLDAKSQIEKLHIWVDTLTCSRDSNDDVIHNDDNNSKKNIKKTSKGGSASPAAKKAHRRITFKNAGDNTIFEDEPLLCREYFFTGECQGLKISKPKKSGASCRHNHYTSKQLTLADATMKSKKSTEKSCDYDYACVEILKRASRAASISQRKLDNTDGNNELDLEKVESIDMLYHMEIPLILTTLEEEMNLSELLSKNWYLRYYSLAESLTLLIVMYFSLIGLTGGKYWTKKMK